MFNCFAHDFEALPPYSAAVSHFVMKPPPAIFGSQVDLQVARQSYLCQVSHIQVTWQHQGLPGGSTGSRNDVADRFLNSDFVPVVFENFH
jgi:hypothetical protein